MRKKIYLVILILSVIAMGVMLYGRINVENQSKSVEILADYDEFIAMADQQDVADLDMLKMLKEAGVSSVALKEETLYNMVYEGKPLEYGLLKNIKTNIDWREAYNALAVSYMESEEANDYDVVVRTKDQATFDFLVSGIDARYDAEFYQIFDGDIKTIILKGSMEDVYFTEDVRYKDYLDRSVKAPKEFVSSMIEDIGLGFDPVKVELIQEAGLNVNLRPNNFNKYNTKIVKAYFDEVEKYGEQPSAMIFNGKEIMSYTTETGSFKQELYDELYERQIPVGMIEADDQLGFNDQKGIEPLAQVLEYNVVRVFPVIEYIQKRYNYLGYYEGGKEIENTLYRAITERNIRMIYFRPFKDSKFTYYTDLDEYKVTFQNLEKRLEPHGITLGKPSVMPYHVNSVYLMMIASLGLLVLGLVILRIVLDIADKFEWVLLVLGAIGVVGINFVAPNVSIMIFTFAAANIFSTLAVIFIIEYMKDILLSNKVYTLRGIIGKSSLGIIIAYAMTMLGGLYVASMMGRADYLLEMSFFRGVKLSLLIPMALFVLIYVIKLGYKRNTRELVDRTYFIEDVKNLLTQNIKAYYVLIAGVLAAVLYVYIARSGHETNIEVLNIELIFRNFLEDHLLARPRTKEIFIAFPALATAIYFAARGYSKIIFPFAFASVIGLTSVVNTFCHSRAPIYLSASRTLISLAFSLVIGAILIVIIDFINRIYVANFGSKKYE